MTGAAEWHINADEPDILDYDTSYKPSAVDAIYEPNEYRSSDHDAVLVGLDLTLNQVTLTAYAAPNPIRFGNSSTVFGWLEDSGDNAPISGATVHLESRTTDDSAWVDTGQTATTAADGSYRFTVSPNQNTQYRASFASDRYNAATLSGPVTVKVAPGWSCVPRRA